MVANKGNKGGIGNGSKFAKKSNRFLGFAPNSPTSADSLLGGVRGNCSFRSYRH